MAKVFPFRPYRYAAKAGDPQNLITQPYDKISPEMQKRYLGLSPHNLVRVILGERLPTDSDTDNVYTRAAKHFREWIDQNILEQESKPAFYAYFQEFTMPDTGERLVRKGFIGLGAVEEYEAKIVHRHEHTLSGPKKDRMEVLKHTGAHFGQIFMLYPDPAGEVDALLDEVARAKPLMEVTDEYNAVHRLWRIDNPEQIAAIQRLMSDKKLLIADGHHRYETALAYRNANPGSEAAGKVMMTFVNMYSPGLRILGTHRVLGNVPGFDIAKLVEKAAAEFTAREYSGLEEIQSAWAEPHADLIRIGVLAEGGKKAYLLEAPRGGRLDVNVLHESILRDILGIGDEAVRNESYIRYVRGADAAAGYVRRGEAQVAFLLEPPTVEQVAEKAFGGGVMPQKSTDFYPKLLTGMTIYKLDA